VSELIIFPKTEADTLLAALAAKGALEQKIETAHIPERCLDVVSQHLVSMAAAGGYAVEDALSVVIGAWPCRDAGRAIAARAAGAA
jgi:ATP-dependent Lhr-like helicase